MPAMIPVDYVSERLLVAISVMVADGDEVVELEKVCLQKQECSNVLAGAQRSPIWQEQL